MKNVKVAVGVIFFLVITLSFAFAKPNNGDGVLKNVFAHTDVQFASVLQNQDEQTFEAPTPSAVREQLRSIRLEDITKECSSGDEVISAYPKVYTLFNSEENRRIIKVFSFTDPKGGKRRIEVYYTGGDWMQYGLTYIVTNAVQDKNQVNAYFVKELSTPNHEDGDVAPLVNPFDSQKLVDFIASDFLGANGNVKEELFNKVASTSVQ